MSERHLFPSEHLKNQNHRLIDNNLRLQREIRHVRSTAAMLQEELAEKDRLIEELRTRLEGSEQDE